ncbi:MAG: glycosyltransferase family 2 protein [Candidatus Anstonellaceae archaeon]
MINIVIPMAGKGSRFEKAGYTFPKPLIEIKGKPMIEIVVRNLNTKNPHKFIFICQKEHVKKYKIDEILKNLTDNCVIIPIERVTQGAAATVLLASEYMDEEEELIIANSDQYIEANIDDFIDEARRKNADGAIMTFRSNHPKWSFVKTNENMEVTEVAEKKPISTEATVGIYYYKKSKYFIEAAKEMIRQNIRVNNEFYVCPTYNQLILEGLKIISYQINSNQMHSLGTPEDLNDFLNSEAYRKL